MKSRNRRERNESNLGKGEFLNVVRRYKFPRCTLHLGEHFPMETKYLLLTLPLGSLWALL